MTETNTSNSLTRSLACTRERWKMCFPFRFLCRRSHTDLFGTGKKNNETIQPVNEWLSSSPRAPKPTTHRRPHVRISFRLPFSSAPSPSPSIVFTGLIWLWWTTGRREILHFFWLCFHNNNRFNFYSRYIFSLSIRSFPSLIFTILFVVQCGRELARSLTVSLPVHLTCSTARQRA